jgi:hypothetical protein
MCERPLNSAAFLFASSLWKHSRFMRPSPHVEKLTALSMNRGTGYAASIQNHTSFFLRVPMINKGQRKPGPAKSLDRSKKEVVVIPYAPVAQLDRASGFEPAGRRFNSCRAHHHLSTTCLGTGPTFSTDCACFVLISRPEAVPPHVGTSSAQ